MTPFATTLAPWQACHLWAELEDARHGKASHGDEAEVYAFRLLPLDPTFNRAMAERDFAETEAGREALRDAAKTARNALVAVGRAFQERYGVRIGVAGRWTLDLYELQPGFTHRVLVRVIHGEGERL